jgi:small subunit ribosomal protein S25e
MDQATYDKMIKEVPTYKLITTAVLVDRLKVNGSVARKALIDMEKKGLIKPVTLCSSLPIYTRATTAPAEAN